MVVVSDLDKNFGGSMDLAKKGLGSADMHTPILPSPPPPPKIISELLRLCLFNQVK